MAGLDDEKVGKLGNMAKLDAKNVRRRFTGAVDDSLGRVRTILH